MPARSPPDLEHGPVRVKVYGLWSVTRRGYLTLLVLGLLLLLGLLAFWLLVPLPAVAAAAPAGGGVLVWVLANLPWLILAAVLLEGMEAVYILRRFRREEALRRARQPKSSP
ncbi:MAG: hypothetical protein L0Z62_02350 [Gemmataceae bacterium]|nr:hypothetical protein [Gemmataceae bacterium]